MVGHKGGVVQRMREESRRPFIFGVHCSGHRLELAYKDAAKGKCIHEKCMTLLLNLYLFYRCSPLNRSNLKASFASLGQTCLIPTRIGGTRWLPHSQRALKNVLSGYKAIVQHLEQMNNPNDPSRKSESSAKAVNFLKLLKDQRVLFWLHLLRDVVECLSIVSTAIQSEDCTISDVWLELLAAKNILKKYQRVDGPHLRKFVESLVDGNKPQNVEGLRQNFLSDLIEALNKRFDGDLHLFKDSVVLSIQKWPSDISEYGDEEIGRLVALCGPAIQASCPNFIAEAVETEWTRIKTDISTEKQSHRCKDWSELYLKYGPGDKFFNLFLLVNFILTLPSSSVEAERGFSKMKIIKNDWRARLKTDSLSDLLMVDIVSPRLDMFDPTPAIHLWNTSGSRSKRPFHMEISSKMRHGPAMDCGQVEVQEGLGGSFEEPEIQSAEVSEKTEIQSAEVSAEELADTGLQTSVDDDDSDDDYYVNKDLIEMQQKTYKMLLTMI